MFHKAIDLKFNEGTSLTLRFQDGKVIKYDMARLFKKYPQLKALKDRKLFLSGKLEGYFIVVWNEELDIEAESIYEFGTLVNELPPAPNIELGDALLNARAKKNMSQKELSQITGISQADISRIEKGISNPSVQTLKRLAAALNQELQITFIEK